MVKLNVAALDEPTLVTDAIDPGAPVIVEPAAMVAAEPVGPVAPVAPVAPACASRDQSAASVFGAPAFDPVVLM
jgi:hypothetical protein